MDFYESTCSECSKTWQWGARKVRVDDRFQPENVRQARVRERNTCPYCGGKSMPRVVLLEKHQVLPKALRGPSVDSIRAGTDRVPKSKSAKILKHMQRTRRW